MTSRVTKTARVTGKTSANTLDRRQLLGRATALGVSLPLIASGLDARLVRSATAQADTRTLIVAIPQATVQLDPAVAGSNGYGDIIPLTDNITEGLTRFRPGSVEVEPALAEAWEVAEDGLSYVFTIRSGVTFHDGTPLDAKAVETNYLRQFDPENPLHTDGMVYAPIVFADVESIEATGDLELTVRLSRPSILVPGNLAIFAAGIVSPTALEAEGADFGQQPVGTGPFKFESWTKDVELVLTANPDYWGGPPAVDRVVFRTIAEDTVRLSDLRTGGVDIANQIDFKDVDEVEADSSLALVTGDFLNVQYLAFNQAAAPFDNQSVRQAVEYAINKQAIAEVIFYDRYTLGAGPIAPGLLGYDQSLATTYAYDPEKARTLLAEAGVGDIAFDLLNRPNSFWPLLGQLVQADLQAVGISVTLKTLEDAEFFDVIGRGETQAYVNDWTWDNGDPDNVMFSVFAAPSTKQRIGYENPRVNELVLAAQLEPDPAVRETTYQEAQALILEDAAVVILGYPERAIGTRATIAGLTVSPVGSLPLAGVSVTG